MDIERRESSVSHRHFFYATQGFNEPYDQFIFRVEGFQANGGESGQLRRMSSQSDNGSYSSLRKQVASISGREEDYLLSNDGTTARQQYSFTMRDSFSKNISCRVDERGSKTLPEHYEKHSLDRQSTVTVKKSILQRMLLVVARCFIPCIK